MKKYKNILSPTMARYLIKYKGLGKYLVDIKPHKDNPLKTIFTFEYSEEISEAMNVYHKSVNKWTL